MQSLKSRHKIRKTEIQTEGGELKYIKLTPYSGGRIEVCVPPGKAEPLSFTGFHLPSLLRSISSLMRFSGKFIAKN